MKQFKLYPIVSRVSTLLVSALKSISSEAEVGVVTSSRDDSMRGIKVFSKSGDSAEYSNSIGVAVRLRALIDEKVYIRKY